MKHSRKSTEVLPARLFAEPERPGDVYTACVDGASRGNPGPAAYAVILRRPDGQVIYQLGKYLGRVTNNVAEYYALITALDYAAANNIHRLRVRSDSELLVRQIQGRYKVKSALLRPLHERAQKLARGLAWFAIEYVPRERNAEADALANEALDRPGHPTAGGGTGPSRVPGRPAREARKIRARYRHGALVPAEPLDLPEGSEVEIEIRLPRRP